jgi:signal peptidase I
MRTWIRQNKGFLVFLLCFGVFRTAVADWNPIPSGSMRPTILEGDVVFVDRLAYDLKLPLTDIVLAPLGEPRRGDIVTFSSPKDGTRLIKRIVGLPGDRIEMHADRLVVNGAPASYDGLGAAAEPLVPGRVVEAVHATEHQGASTRAIQFLPEIRARRDFGPFVVPRDSYFMLGDNRDNSEDSRFIGVVPRRLLIGRANRILVSADVQGHWSPRLERVGKALE